MNVGHSHGYHWSPSAVIVPSISPIVEQINAAYSNGFDVIGRSGNIGIAANTVNRHIRTGIQAKRIGIAAPWREIVPFIAPVVRSSAAGQTVGIVAIGGVFAGCRGGNRAGNIAGVYRAITSEAIGPVASGCDANIAGNIAGHY